MGNIVQTINTQMAVLTGICKITAG